MIKATDKRKCLIGLQFQSVRVHDDGAKVWQHEQLRGHILMHP